MGGTRIVDRVRSALEPVTDALLLVANDPQAPTWLPHVPVRADVFPGAGGLAGVHAALVDGRSALVVAWDMPFVNAELLRLIRDEGVASGADACVPESPSPHGIEPFCAWYAASLRAPLEAFLRSGGGAARDFLGGRAVHRIPGDAIAALGDPARLLLSVNSVDDLERARSLHAAR